MTKVRYLREGAVNGDDSSCSKKNQNTALTWYDYFYEFIKWHSVAFCNRHNNKGPIFN